MNKQHNDQDDKQAPSEDVQNGTPSTSDAQAGNGANAQKDNASGRRSRRYNKSGNAHKRDEQNASKSADSQVATPAASAPEAASSSKTAKPESAAGKSASGKKTAEKRSPAQSDKKASGSANSGGKGGSGSGSQQAGSHRGGSKTGAVALVLTVALGAAGGYFGWQLWQKLDAQSQAVSALPDAPVSQTALNSLKDELKNSEQQRDQAVQSSLEKISAEFGDYRASVNGTLDKVLTQLSQEQQTDERDWLHAEAAYLLRLANQRLQLERDVVGAVALLQTADERLEEADNPALTPVRRAIASELAELKSVPRVDSTGIYLELNALQERVSSLPLNQDIEEIVADATIEEAPTGGWQSQLSTFGNELKGLVTVRKHDQALEALISPEQESYLRQSLRLVLEQSQLALLKQEQELYDASLNKALTLIRGYYDMDNAGVKAVVENIETLRAEQVHPELPDISGSQQAIGQFIQQRFEGGSRQGDNA
ncbi:uroporphyrinogen-III C-methyltransferase [Halomonas halocynthiae]|uniref:uroporphyrinogen-III C-methyltransferase n=1 Tax=Halomonas halocynthiae TaxID=176290 RepID=UPI0004038D5F|nr:uroporphyrinogen-III C-methyltransferase [Halomonas halocynthiae]